MKWKMASDKWTISKALPTPVVKKYNYAKVLRVFRKHYNPIPLEIYKDNPYEVLISTLLSSRTRDEVSLVASNRLFEKAPDVEKLDKLDLSEIANLIYPVGFYKTKATHLKDLAMLILTRHNGNIPDTLEKLTSLPGVGRKTANLVLQKAFNKPAIAADTHVHRISNLLGWVKTRSPVETELALMKVVPQKYWPEINRLFVSIGRQFYSKKKLEDFLKINNLI